MACLASGAMFANFQDSFVYSNLNSSYVSKIDFQESLFSGVVLTYWDNIIGPRLGHLWLESDEKCKQEHVTYVVSHTLNGELTRQAPKNAVDSKFFIIQQKGLVFSSYIFKGLAKATGETLCSLSLLLPFSALKKYMPFQELVDVRMELLVAKLRVLQERDHLTSISNFSKYLVNLLSAVSSLLKEGLPSDLPVSCGVFNSDNSTSFNSSFLEKCITSHLQTFGSSVVIGKTVKEVNLMMNTLALFLSAEERCLSRYVTDGKMVENEPDLFLQGIITKEDGTFELSSKGVLTNRFPTTMIDLEKEEVQQSCLYVEHLTIRQQFLNLELEFLFNDDENAPLYPALGLFHHMKHDSKIIKDMLSDVQLIPPQDSIRLAFIENFKRLLRRKAVALIKYIEDLSKFGCDRMDGSRLQEARRQLHLTKDGDFLIILAVAEKLRPNIYMCALGENASRATESIFRNVLGSL